MFRVPSCNFTSMVSRKQSWQTLAVQLCPVDSGIASPKQIEQSPESSKGWYMSQSTPFTPIHEIQMILSTRWLQGMEFSFEVTKYKKNHVSALILLK